MDGSRLAAVFSALLNSRLNTSSKATDWREVPRALFNDSLPPTLVPPLMLLLVLPCTLSDAPKLKLLEAELLRPLLRLEDRLPLSPNMSVRPYPWAVVARQIVKVDKAARKIAALMNTDARKPAPKTSLSDHVKGSGSG